MNKTVPKGLVLKPLFKEEISPNEATTGATKVSQPLNQTTNTGSVSQAQHYGSK